MCGCETNGDMRRLMTVNDEGVVLRLDTQTHTSWWRPLKAAVVQSAVG